MQTFSFEVQIDTRKRLCSFVGTGLFEDDIDSPEVSIFGKFYLDTRFIKMQLEEQFDNYTLEGVACFSSGAVFDLEFFCWGFCDNYHL